MKHTTIDCYGANEHQLDDMKLVNQLLTEVTYMLDVDPICPPCIIPYYYGKVREDIGISAYIFLNGGHITIHTFPIRECYFVDCFLATDFDEKKLYNFFAKELPFDAEMSIVNTVERKTGTFQELPYDPVADFGPHIMAEIKRNGPITMEEMFDFLEATAVAINMDPITRPMVVKSTMDNPDYLSGIIVIAQSHIALHYEYATNKIFADIFSCTYFDYSLVSSILSSLGVIVSNELVARGTKHIYKVRSNVTKDELLASTKWQKVVHKINQ